MKAPIRSDVSLSNIEEFVPDEYLDKSFLEDTGTQVGMTVNRQFTTNDSDRYCMFTYGIGRLYVSIY